MSMYVNRANAAALTTGDLFERRGYLTAKLETATRRDVIRRCEFSLAVIADEIEQRRRMGDSPMSTRRTNPLEA